MDISHIKSESFGGRKFWLLIVDDCTDMCWSYFLKTKDETSKVVTEFLLEMNSLQVRPRYIRCDNSGENRKTEELCRTMGLGMIFEYTAPSTPQQNGRVERKFATLYGRVRAMMNYSGFEEELRGKLWAECAKTATDNENICLKNKHKSPYERFYGESPKFVKDMRIFGEVRIIKSVEKIRSKLKNPGFPAIFIGYADNHSCGTFRFFNPSSSKVIMSRNVKWLGKTY